MNMHPFISQKLYLEEDRLDGHCQIVFSQQFRADLFGFSYTFPSLLLFIATRYSQVC